MNIMARTLASATVVAGILAGCSGSAVLSPTTSRKVVVSGWTVELDEITTSSCVDFKSGKWSRWLQIRIWINPPEKSARHLRKVADVYFVKAIDERGRALPVTKEKTKEIHEGLHRGNPTDGWASRHYGEIASLYPLPYLPRRLKYAKLRMYTATAATTVTRELDLAVMEKPITIVPGFRFQIKQVVRNAQGLLLSFDYTSDYPDPKKEDPRTVPLLVERSLVDRFGHSIFGVTSSSSGTGDGAVYEIAGQMRLDPDKKRVPVKLRLVVATKVALDAFDFEFHNLPVTGNGNSGE